MSQGAPTISVSRASRLTAREVLPGGFPLPRLPAGINLSVAHRAAPRKSARVVCAEAAGGTSCRRSIAFLTHVGPSTSRLPTIHQLSRARTSPTPVRASSPGHPRHRTGRCVSIGVLSVNFDGQSFEQASASEEEFARDRCSGHEVFPRHLQEAGTRIRIFLGEIKIAQGKLRFFQQFSHQDFVVSCGDLHVPAALLSAALFVRSRVTT